MAIQPIPPIELTQEHLDDIATALAMLDDLGPVLDAAAACGTPGLDDCQQQREELRQRLLAYREHFGSRKPTAAVPKRRRK